MIYNTFRIFFIFFFISSFFVACDSQEEGDPLGKPSVHIIFSVSPSSGPEGSIVTIEGMHFSEIVIENKVLFGGIEAEVLQGTTQVLKVRVPEGAQSGKIAVKINGNTSMSPSEFTVVD